MAKSQAAFRWIALVLTLILLIPLISCSQQVENTSNLTTTVSPTPTPTSSTSAPPSTILSLSGEVLVQKNGSTAWVEAVTGMNLEVGDWLKTGGNGTVVLLFFEGSTIECQANTEILINNLNLDAGTGSTNIGLKQLVGSTVNRVQKLVDSESKYEVDTPAASAVVRGTVFRLLVEGDGNTTLYSDEGDVWFTAGNITVLVGTGMKSFACMGCPPTNPSPDVTPTPIATTTPTPLPTPTPTPILTPTPVPTIPFYYWPAPTTTPTPFSGPPQVQIANPENGSTTSDRLLTVSGSVTSASEINTSTGATIALNGNSRYLPLTRLGTAGYNYSFSTTLELIQGSNNITVTATDSQDRNGSDIVTVNADIPVIGIRAELTWNTNDTDVDGHLIAPGYAMGDDFGDCYYSNVNPDWGGPGGNSTGDPSLDQDIQTGYGPEHIVLIAPPFDGVYQYKVHYYSDNGHGNSTATVKIMVNDVLVFEGNKTLSDDEVWDCACISWPSGNVTAGPCATHTLTVTSQGCCPILVEGLQGGNRTVTAGNTSVFYTPANATVTLTAQTGEGCNFGYWQVDGGNSTEENPITVTMDADHQVTAVCVPAYSLQVSSSGCCPVLVEGLPGGNQTVPAGNTTYFEAPENWNITLTAQTGGGCYFDYWQVDEGNSTAENPIIVIMDSNHVATAYCGLPQ